MERMPFQAAYYERHDIVLIDTNLRQPENILNN